MKLSLSEYEFSVISSSSLCSFPSYSLSTMASLALTQTRLLIPSLRQSIVPKWLVPVFASASLSAPGLSWSLPSLQSLLELFPPFLLAVPKSKTSHSRKAMRAANKGLKDKQSVSRSFSDLVKK